MRARIVLECAAGGTILGRSTSKLDIDVRTVWKRRSRFVEHRLAGLHDELRPGKPRSIDDERVAELIKTTLHKRPTNGSTHWMRRASVKHWSKRNRCCPWALAMPVHRSRDPHFSLHLTNPIAIAG